MAWLLVSLVTLSMITFGLGVLAPGDPAEVVLERRLNQPPPQEQIDAQRRIMGLDRPLPVQYLRWAPMPPRVTSDGRGCGGCGSPRRSGSGCPEPRRWPRPAAAISVLIGVPTGMLAAVRRNSLADHACRVAALIGASVPSYFIAYVLILVFAVKFSALPVFGFGSAANLVLPAVTLALGPAAVLARLTRSTVLEVLGEDYIRTARAKGAPQSTVLAAHALRNSLIPILTVIGLSLGHLLGGALIVEYVFAWPGMGELAISAIQARDYPLIQGFVLFAGAVYVLVNFSVDLGYAWLDPRIRVGGRR